MKPFTTTALTLLLATGSLFAKPEKIASIIEKEAAVLSSSVSKVVVLGENKNTDVTYRLLLIDRGQSTDLSPRYQIQLTYFHGGESNNTQTAFVIGNCFSLTSTKRVEAGIYQIVAKEHTEKGIVDVTYTVNTHQVALDDKKFRTSLGELADRYFPSTITVSK